MLSGKEMNWPSYVNCAEVVNSCLSYMYAPSFSGCLPQIFFLSTLFCLPLSPYTTPPPKDVGSRQALCQWATAGRSTGTYAGEMRRWPKMVRAVQQNEPICKPLGFSSLVPQLSQRAVQALHARCSVNAGFYH